MDSLQDVCTDCLVTKVEIKQDLLTYRFIEPLTVYQRIMISVIHE